MRWLRRCAFNVKPFLIKTSSLLFYLFLFNQAYVLLANEHATIIRFQSIKMSLFSLILIELYFLRRCSISYLFLIFRARLDVS